MNVQKFIKSDTAYPAYCLSLMVKFCYTRTELFAVFIFMLL